MDILKLKVMVSLREDLAKLTPFSWYELGGKSRMVQNQGEYAGNNICSCFLSSILGKSSSVLAMQMGLQGVAEVGGEPSPGLEIHPFREIYFIKTRKENCCL